LFKIFENRAQVAARKKIFSENLRRKRQKKPKARSDRFEFLKLIKFNWLNRSPLKTFRARESAGSTLKVSKDRENFQCFNIIN
jgi:hypothetical protein